MRNRKFIVAGMIGLLFIAWHFGRPKKVTVPADKPVANATEPAPAPSPAEPPKPLAEGLDLSRAFNPASDEEISPLVLASFVAPEPAPAQPSMARYRTLLIGVDALNPTGLRLGWLGVPLPAAEPLDIMPREIGN